MRLDHIFLVRETLTAFWSVVGLKAQRLDCYSIRFICIKAFRSLAGEVTPVPIPNTEVKLPRADGTAWVTAWESRTLRELFKRAPRFLLTLALFFCVKFGEVLTRFLRVR